MSGKRKRIWLVLFLFVVFNKEKHTYVCYVVISPDAKF